MHFFFFFEIYIHIEDGKKFSPVLTFFLTYEAFMIFYYITHRSTFFLFSWDFLLQQLIADKFLKNLKGYML